MDVEVARFNMIEQQIRPWGVVDSWVLDLLKKVPREDFVLPEQKGLAFADLNLPIGLNEAMWQPKIEARILQALAPSRSDRVLEIGTGSGYQAAVLAKLVKHVYTIEIIPDLAHSALTTLNLLGYNNISVKIGDGYNGWPEQAPFDRIIITAAPEETPQILLDQLKPGGRMVIPVGPQWKGQELLLIEKDLIGKEIQKKTLPVRFVPMVHEK